MAVLPGIASGDNTVVLESDQTDREVSSELGPEDDAAVIRSISVDPAPTYSGPVPSDDGRESYAEGLEPAGVNISEQSNAAVD